jgi:hypothetical protein
MQELCITNLNIVQLVGSDICVYRDCFNGYVIQNCRKAYGRSILVALQTNINLKFKNIL